MYNDMHSSISKCHALTCTLHGFLAWHLPFTHMGMHNVVQFAELMQSVAVQS